jgi:hypothetical protein
MDGWHPLLTRRIMQAKVEMNVKQMEAQSKRASLGLTEITYEVSYAARRTGSLPDRSLDLENPNKPLQQTVLNHISYNLAICKLESQLLLWQMAAGIYGRRLLLLVSTWGMPVTTRAGSRR